MEEQKPYEVRNWKRIYILIIVFLIAQIFLFNLITEYFE